VGIGACGPWGYWAWHWSPTRVIPGEPAQLSGKRSATAGSAEYLTSIGFQPKWTMILYSWI